MKKSEIVVGGHYQARVSGNFVTVRVDAIRERQGLKRAGIVYEITNLNTGRRTRFRSAAKFRGVADRSKVTAKQAISQRDKEAFADMEDANREALAAVARGDSEQADQLLHNDELGKTLAAAGEEERPEPWVPSHVQRSGLGLGKAIRHAAKNALKPTEEQQAVIDLAQKVYAARDQGQRILVIAAGAGAGKTSTLKMLENALPGRGQYTAFNRSLVDESATKFKKVSCKTSHGLAYGAVGRLYAHRLKNSRVRSFQVAAILGIKGLTVEVSDTSSETGIKEKILAPGFLASLVTAAVRRFCQSADREVSARHFGREVAPGLDGKDPETGQQDTTNSDAVKDYLLPYARKAWADLSSVDGTLPAFTHDCYVKIWQLGEGKDAPMIPTDYILLDESQDSAPVLLDVLKRQTHALFVMVGDSNQAIYEWRGAVDAMKAFPNAPRAMLSQSFRFGQTVADVANSILAELDEPTDLVMRGLPSVPSRVGPVAEPRCVLCRTNAGAVGKVLTSIQEGKRPHLIGGGSEVVAFVRAARDLQEGRRTQHPELCCFDSWAEVEQAAKEEEGRDLELMVRLIKQFGCSEIIGALEHMPREAEADLVVCTAHKSKGREWDSVKLASDFPTPNRLGDADLRLLYVAATRARLLLDIEECPPFLDHKDYDGREWSGIRVQYTVPMPTQEVVDAYLAARAERKEAEPVGVSAPEPVAVEVSTPASAPNGSRQAATGFTWTRYEDEWCIRGPAEKTGGLEKVERKNGTFSHEKLEVVVRKFPEAWIYRAGRK